MPRISFHVMKTEWTLTEQRQVKIKRKSTKKVAKKQPKQYNEKETTKNLEEKNNFFLEFTQYTNSQRTHTHTLMNIRTQILPL